MQNHKWAMKLYFCIDHEEIILIVFERQFDLLHSKNSIMHTWEMHSHREKSLRAATIKQVVNFICSTATTVKHMQIIISPQTYREYILDIDK